jgi:hypothetical protein
MGVRFISAGLACCFLAAFQHFYLTPQFTRVPSDYVNETSYNATTRTRESATAPWTESSLVARRVDQMLVSSAHHGILQGDLHWTNAAGQVEFETTAMFGIDRHTRENLPGYGDAVRTGPFLFPLHTEAKNYRYWDTQFIGHCDAVFKHVTHIGKLRIFAYAFTAKGLDETAGYSHLPDVPERYRVLTNAQGTLWVEPDSGQIVDYEEEGVSYLVEPGSRKRVGDIYIWKDRFTPATKAAKVAQAGAERIRISLLEFWLPAALAFAGLIALLFGMRMARFSRRGHAAVSASAPEVYS